MKQLFYTAAPKCTTTATTQMHDHKGGADRSRRTRKLTTAGTQISRRLCRYTIMVTAQVYDTQTHDHGRARSCSITIAVQIHYHGGRAHVYVYAHTYNGDGGVRARVHVYAVTRSRQVCIYWLWKHCLFCRDCLWRGKTSIYS